ncbi:hypothetical protein ACIRST_22570 [Kitasatospora sp. NPDC101447]|uniref:hypothetical protein n=1 Tax=Kitasatospora sp. NPDC101447 TaxID=3364102 RepID=UPI003800D88D
MVGAVLIGILVLVVAGCGCVVWADRGGPAWTRVVATITVRAGEVLPVLLRSWGRKNKNSGDSGD